MPNKDLLVYSNNFGGDATNNVADSDLSYSIANLLLKLTSFENNNKAATKLAT